MRGSRGAGGWAGGDGGGSYSRSGSFSGQMLLKSYERVHILGRDKLDQCSSKNYRQKTTGKCNFCLPFTYNADLKQKNDLGNSLLLIHL